MQANSRRAWHLVVIDVQNL